MEVVIDDFGSEMSWTIEGQGINCSGNAYEDYEGQNQQGWEDGGEPDPNWNVQYLPADPDCCIPDNATWKLTCMDEAEDGWDDGRVIVNGVAYCQEEFGFQTEVYFGSNSSLNRYLKHKECVFVKLMNLQFPRVLHVPY